MNFAVTKKSAGARPLAALVAALAVGACAGENLFSAAGTGGTGPEVEITAPTEGAEVNTGESVSVTAAALAQNGASSVQYRGIYSSDQSTAYTSQTSQLNGLVSLSLSTSLVAAPGQEDGEALIIVTVTDQIGEVGADTVKVTITTPNE